MSTGGFFTDDYSFAILDNRTGRSVTRGQSTPIYERGQVYQFFDIPIDSDAYEAHADFGDEIELCVYRKGRIIFRGALIPHFVKCCSIVGSSAAETEPWTPPFRTGTQNLDAYCSPTSFHVEPQDSRRAPYTSNACALTSGALADYAFSTCESTVDHPWTSTEKEEAKLLTNLRARRPCSQWIRYEIEYPLIADFVLHANGHVALRRIAYVLPPFEQRRVTVAEPVPWSSAATVQSTTITTSRNAIAMPQDELVHRLQLLDICA